MSDAVMIALIGSISTTLGIITVAYLNTRQNKNIANKVDEVKKNTDGLVTAALSAKDETSEAKQALSKAEGKAEGIAEKQPEIDKLNKDANHNDENLK